MAKKRFTKEELRALEREAQERTGNLSGGRLWRILDFCITLPLIVMLAFGIRAFIFEPVRVEGNSMYPTLLNGEHMLCEKVSYMFTRPSRGDIVICRYPGYSEDCVKRVIGLPGETVEVRDGVVYIDGVQLDESGYYDGYINQDYGPITVPEDCVFVMGDNRNNSKDSRASTVGPLPYTRISGRVFYAI